MSIRVSLTSLIAGKIVVGVAGHGVLAQLVPSAGDHGPGLAFSSLSFPADNGKEIRVFITTQPTLGTLYVFEDTSFTFLGPNGTHTFQYQVYVDGVALGTPQPATVNVGASPATALTLTGPSNGTVGASSAAFNVGANGTVAGGVIYTLSDAGGGGTFTPATGTPPGYFAYTPSSTGAKTISITNSGGLTNPASLSFFVGAGAASMVTAESAAYAMAVQDATLKHILPTVGRPISDTSNTGWLASTGSALYAVIDEVIPDDSDYISSTSAGSVCQMALNNTAYPGAATQVFEFRAASANGNTVQARLKNSGGATVATWMQVLTPNPTTYQKALTAGEIALISAGALSLELTAI